MIPISDLKRQIQPIRKEIEEAISKVIDNTNFILGTQVKELEDEIAAYSGAKYAVGVSNGTDAIRLALVALGVGADDAVLCPAFTYYATAGAIASIGAIPVFVDIDERTYNISVAEIEKVIKERSNLKFKAIIPVHLYGQCADMDEILNIAKKYNLKVIEDTAQAFGAEYKDKKAGTLGDCGAISFFPGKNLGAFGDAGMVLTNSQPCAEALKLLRNQGNAKKYYHQLIGFNNRLDTLQAAILKVKLKYLDSWNSGRKKNAEFFNSSLDGLKLKTPFKSNSSTHIYHQYVLCLDDPENQKFCEYLRAKGVDARIYYPAPLHLQECFKYLGYQAGDFPVSERSSRRVAAIPVFSELTKEEKEFIATSIKEFLK